MQPMVNLNQSDLDELVNDPTLVNMKVENYQVNLAAVFDDSFSMNGEYQENHVQLLADRVLAIAIALDTDKKIDVFTLNRGYIGTMDSSDYEGWINRNVKTSPNGTPYTKALEAVMKHYGYTIFNTFFNAFKAIIGVRNGKKPTLVIFVTDGEATDKEKTTPFVADKLAGRRDIFVQFMGLGDTSFDYLKELVSYGDNLSFFHMPCPDEAPVPNSWVYQQLITPFSKWMKRNK